MKVSIPARRSFTPAAIPPIPAPTTTTLGVPEGPNSSVADGLKSDSPPSLAVAPRAGSSRYPVRHPHRTVVRVLIVPIPWAIVGLVPLDPD